MDKKQEIIKADQQLHDGLQSKLIEGIDKLRSTEADRKNREEKEKVEDFASEVKDCLSENSDLLLFLVNETKGWAGIDEKLGELIKEYDLSSLR